VTLRLLDLFSGIGGFSYAAERLVGGYETVAFVEREPFCQSVLRKHWPTVPIHDDICKFQPERHSADVVCGGFPCQDISLAGKQAGIKQGTRSGLFYELIRVVRVVQPRYVVLENVAAILANGLDIVLGELAEAGFDAEWACIPASAVGACHRRDRWWCVAYATHMLSHGSPAGHAGEFGVGAVSELGDGSGAGDPGPDILLEMLECRYRPVADTSNVRSRRQELPLSAMRGSDKRRKAAVGDWQTFGPQPGQQWRTGNQSLNPNWQAYVSKPVLCRGDDGFSNRVDRLKALGNAVVPQVAAIPLARVLELESVRATHPAGDPPSCQQR
jgi:DNA (cytosine-5)-methyltransferase 1